MVLIQDEALVINALVKFMEKNNIKDMYGAGRTGNWEDFCIELNKIKDLNEQYRLAWQWNKLNSTLKQKFLEKLNLTERVVTVLFSAEEWNNFIAKFTTSSKIQFLVEFDNILSYR